LLTIRILKSTVGLARADWQF
ncbi:hypothetical protein EVA_21410, partial [gut metagenome]